MKPVRLLAALIGLLALTSLPADATTGSRFNMPYVTGFDATGIVMPGGKLYFYVTGTTTPAITYSDQNLSTPNANPVVANGAGLFPSIFLNPSVTYKVTLTDASDDQIWTADPVSGGLTNAAVNCQGAAVDVAANIQSAINALEASGGGKITLSSGICKTTAALTVNSANGIYITGQGQAATTLAPSGSFNAISYSGGFQNGGVSDLTIDATNLGAAYNDIYVNDYSRFAVKNVTGQNTKNFLYDESSNVLDVDTVHVFNVSGTYCFEVAAPGAARSDVMNFTNVQCGGAVGSHYWGLIANGYVNTINIHNFSNSAPTGGGILSENTNGGTLPPQFWFIHDFQIEQASHSTGNTGSGIDLEAAIGFYCSNCYSSSNVNYGALIASTASDIHFSDPFIALNGSSGIQSGAASDGTGNTGLVITGGNITANGQEATGTLPEINLLSTSRHTMIVGTNLSGGTATYGVTVAAGALYTILADNNYTAATTGAVNDLSGVSAILGGVGSDGVAYGPTIMDGGVNGTKQLQFQNTGTSGTSVASVDVFTGTANAFVQMNQTDGATPTGSVNSGAGNTGGLSVHSDAGPVTLDPAGSFTDTTKPLRIPHYTVATLPTCDVGMGGALAAVTDATAPTYNGALVGGGSVAVPVFCDGSAWRSH